ncbi:hypothetical protein COBT_003651, partial [Conglomerata obtusa]
MYKIGYDISETKDPPIIIVNSNKKQPGMTFNSTARIEKFGTLYRIKIGPVYLCSKNLKIEPCAANHYDLWEIRQEKFGYAILKSTN